ncbi:hypothetical protein BDV18DRAFT_117866 [Aspergillus unguis]
MSSRRRNGQAASCEPCRMHKVRCDHGQPICGRCQKRNISSRCFYHPAPLTQEASRSSPNRRSRTPQTSRSVKAQSRNEVQRPASPTPSSVEITIRCPETEQYMTPIYFGPTSFVTSLGGNTDNTFTSTDDDRQMPGGGHPVLPSYLLPETTKMLSAITEDLSIDKLVCDFYGDSQAAILPSLLVDSFMTEFRNVVNQNETPQTLHKKTTQILETTARIPRIPADIKGKDLHTIFSGENMRLEIMGILYAIAGRASMFGYVNERFPGSAWTASTARLKFARRMLTLSDTAVQVCKILTPVNDLTTWLLYENWLLSSMSHGDSSSRTWDRLGEVCSCIVELGLHRDCEKSDKIPTFIREIRRRLFAGLYHNDKNIATFFGRPPHISWRYSDCKPPLDISEDVLMGDEQDLQRAMKDLNEDGWNVDRTFRRSSWHRLRYLITMFREEILELSLRPVDAEAAGKLKDISFRCTQFWDSVPAHLRYPACEWDDSHHIGIRIMLLIAYFLYLYNIFLIERLLIQHDSSAESALLKVSSEILSLVLLLGRQQEPMIDIRSDFNAILILYGFCSAGTLLKALQAQVRTGTPVPYTGSIPELIRNLSVFISHIETSAQPNTPNMNHALLERASKMFKNILDEVLESRLSMPSTTTVAAEADMGLNATAGEELDVSWAGDGMEFLDTLDFGAVFDQLVF